jgi:tRNA(adenine34) deaminase
MITGPIVSAMKKMRKSKSLRPRTLALQLHIVPVSNAPFAEDGGTAMSDKKKWVQNVKSIATSPPEGTFTKDAPTIARIMASKKVSPKGVGSGIRMIQYFINRAGKNLPPARKRELEKAKRLLQARLNA